MKKKAVVILEYILAILVVILLAMAIAGVIVVKFHGEDLKDYVLEQINQHVDTQIDVESIKVKVFHKFPNTSIIMTDITIWSSHNFDGGEFPGKPADTLMSAESLSMSFNLLGMIRKKFNIRQVEVKNGILQILTDSKGEGNYLMLKEGVGESGENRSIDINQLRISDFKLKMDNRAKQLKTEADLKSLELNGRFSRRNTQIRGGLRAQLNEISNKGVIYASDRNVGVRISLDLQDSLYTVDAGQLQIDRIVADVDGQFLVHKGKGVELKLTAAARDLEIHEVLDLLPSELAKPLQEIRGNGNMEISAQIDGMASSTLTPSLSAEYQTNDANLFWEQLPFSVKNLDLRGSYSNGGEFSPLTTSLTVSSISASIGDDQIKGKGRISNFLDPDFAVELEGELHPGQWLNWYPSIHMDEIAGIIISDLKVSGSYERLRPKGKRFPVLDIEGTLGLEDVMLRINPEGIPFKKVNGKVSIDNDFWKPSFTGIFGSSDFQISGSGLNLISFFIEEEVDLVASAKFSSHYLDLQEILDQISREGTGDKSPVKFPEKLDLRLEFIIDDFVKDKLKAKNVRGLALYDSPLFFVDSLSMQTMEGTIMGSFGMAQSLDGSIYSTVDASLYRLNINELFEAFNNFGQQQLTDAHLEGTVSGSSLFSANFDPSFKIIPSSILSESKVSITNGELNGFTPIMALSRFVDVEELQNIRFQTLENDILIKESQVIIPAMAIESNALNLTASGIHNFNNHYDYRLRLKLSQILYRKAKRGNRSSEFDVAEDESDRRTLFLKVYDKGEGADVEMDREQASQKIREDLKEEKSELKMILNKELGLFKHDDELNEEIEKKKREEEQMFRFEFDEDPDSTENKPAVEFVIDE